jgi:2-polyprenyl-3-methyl-5-hydroxy-6-metoxy-1,4-benzoquinol methylase
MGPFTAHNICLPGGEYTVPGEPVMADGPLVGAIMNSLDVAFAGDVAGKTIVDLGCLEGGYTVEFARAGLDALGMEARKANVERCQYAAGRLGLPNLRFVLDDVRNINRYGSFDAVFCSGLLYHLDDPTAYLRTLAGVTRRVLVLQTHYATVEESWRQKDFGLSPLTAHEGNVGRWYPEYDESDTRDVIERNSWAAYGNHQSFWIEKRHLLQTLRDVGFSPVYEQFDFLTNVVLDGYIEYNNRSLFVAYRAGASPETAG